MRTCILLLCLIIFVSCKNEISFNSEKWNEKEIDWQLGTTREKMVSDVISSDTLIGMSSPQIIKLLGEPEFTEEKSLKFLVREKYSTNVDPDYIKYLIVELEETGKAKKVFVKKS